MSPPHPAHCFAATLPPSSAVDEDADDDAAVVVVVVVVVICTVPTSPITATEAAADIAERGSTCAVATIDDMVEEVPGG
jgi:hypothetical protein